MYYKNLVRLRENLKLCEIKELATFPYFDWTYRGGDLGSS